MQTEEMTAAGKVKPDEVKNIPLGAFSFRVCIINFTNVSRYFDVSIFKRPSILLKN